jgi:branched-chain amino acid transport system substrate-binding protein
VSGAPFYRLATRLSCFALLAFGLLPAPPAGAQEVKIGILFGVTGKFSSFVPPLLDSVKLAVDEINAGGGILDGQKLQTVLADTKGTAQGAIDAATTLVKTDDVAAIIGANTGTTTIAAAHAVTVPNGVLLISPSATATVMTTMEDKDFVFRLAPSDAYQGWALAKFAHDQGFDRVAMTFVGNEYGAGMQLTFRNNFENYGGTITAAQVYEANKSSHLPELAALTQFEPQALVVIDYAAAGGITMIKDALAQGHFKYFIGPHSMMDPLLLKEIGADKLKGSIFTVPTIDYSTSAAQKFQKLYNAAFKTTANK